MLCKNFKEEKPTETHGIMCTDRLFFENNTFYAFDFDDRIKDNW